MKWFFIVVALILMSFIGVMIWGYFLPATSQVERSLSLNAYADEISEVLEDPIALPQWMPWLDGVAGNSLVTGGSEMGEGVSLAWQNGPAGREFGSLRINQFIADQRMVLDGDLPSGAVELAIAIMPEDGSDNSLVLMRQTHDLGGFPWLGRVRAQRNEPEIAAELDAALIRLKTIVEAGYED